ncbi:hypothetical protein AV530_003830 [Patagioenas fasciata monilis]|uniref:Uncharacterized protein n=1 Tax=Patagioenas fasciata monilis TaxID=372326 RepID=A0A1V4L0B8_PATFA|nr:hypothetical protein AV530_003830 [Patagioenas fasciata monilis]
MDCKHRTRSKHEQIYLLHLKHVTRPNDCSCEHKHYFRRLIKCRNLPWTFLPLQASLHPSDRNLARKTKHNQVHPGRHIILKRSVVVLHGRKGVGLVLFDIHQSH